MCGLVSIASYFTEKVEVVMLVAYDHEVPCPGFCWDIDGPN